MNKPASEMSPIRNRACFPQTVPFDGIEDTFLRLNVLVFAQSKKCVMELTGRHDDKRMKSAGESDECETTRNS